MTICYSQQRSGCKQHTSLRGQRRAARTRIRRQCLRRDLHDTSCCWRGSNAARRPHCQHRLHRLENFGPTPCIRCDKSCNGCADNVLGWRGKLSLVFFHSSTLNNHFNETSDSLARAMGLPSIHSHPVQFQQICRKRIWWPLMGLRLRFSFLCMNRRELRIASGQWRIWPMLRYC